MRVQVGFADDDGGFWHPPMLVAASSPRTPSGSGRRAPDRGPARLAGWNAPPHPRLGHRARHRPHRAVLVWPQAFGLQNQWVAAHVVALRGMAAAGGHRGGGALRCCSCSCARCARFGASRWRWCSPSSPRETSAVLAVRGVGGASAGGAAASGSVTVLSWNTLGEVPDASVIAGLALDEGADVIVLPETTGPLGEEVAIAMREGGSPMWVHTVAFDEVAKARSTTILISPELGEYRVVSELVPGPPGNTNTLPSIVADPIDGDGPRIVAVHAVAPIRWELRNWRSDLDWLADAVRGGNVIMAGDFNATLDHFAGHGIDGGDLGRCADAAAAGGAGGARHLADRPCRRCFGSPIDHVLATPNWAVDAFRVLEASTSPAATTGRSWRPSARPAERATRAGRAAVREWKNGGTRRTPRHRTTTASLDRRTEEPTAEEVGAQREPVDHAGLRGVQALHRQRLGRARRDAPARTRAGRRSPRRGAPRSRRRSPACASSCRPAT